MPCGAVSDIKQVSVQEANEAVGRAGVQFVDVRTPDEFKSGHAAKAVNIPLDVIEKESAALDKEKPVYLICRSGRRSQQAAETLKNAGFKEIYNVTGGTQAWTAANLPLEK
ncbi:MAG: rhodanese-like domain-containing protein [Acidobacteria bacterium]|nr:rhodanese-like domain-containing protein [Acidobacteriota bacterium]